MRLTEILKRQDIKIPLTAKTKSEAIAELVQVLADNNEIMKSPMRRKFWTRFWNAKRRERPASETAWRFRTANARGQKI
jgi:hypothetical protein